MATARLVRAALGLVLLFCSILSDAATDAGGVAGARYENARVAKLGGGWPRDNPFDLRVSGDTDTTLTLRVTLDEAVPKCDDGNEGKTTTGNAVLSGSVSVAFTLADVSASVVLRCGEESSGTTTSFELSSPTTTDALEVTVRGEKKTLSSFSIAASVYEDVDADTFWIAGTLQSRADDDAFWFDTSCSNGSAIERAGRVRHDNPEGLSLDVSFPPAARSTTGVSDDDDDLGGGDAQGETLVNELHGWGVLSMKLSEKTDAVKAVAVGSRTRGGGGGGEDGGRNSSVNTLKANDYDAADATDLGDDAAVADAASSSAPYRLVVTALFPSEVLVDVGGSQVETSAYTVALTNAVVTLWHEAEAAFDISSLPAFNAVDWRVTISGGVEVKLPGHGVTLSSSADPGWTKSFLISGGATALESKLAYVIGDPDNESGATGDKIEIDDAKITCSNPSIDLVGNVQVMVPGGGKGELFAGDGIELTIHGGESSSSTGPSFAMEPFNVSVTYDQAAKKLTLEGKGDEGGTMEVGTVPVEDVEVSVEMSSNGAASVSLQGKVSTGKGEDCVKYPGVPELNFNYLTAGVNLEVSSDGSLEVTETTFAGKVNQKVEGKIRHMKQAVFTILGELEFAYPCVDKVFNDMVAWGEVPNGVLMRDMNVTFEYDCGNTHPGKPYWSIVGASEEPEPATTLYVGSKDFVELQSLKVQGLAYRAEPGRYTLSNLFFGTVASSNLPDRVKGSRASFSYDTETDQKLREIEAVDHVSPTLNASMVFRHQDTAHCEDHGVIGTARVSLAIGKRDACGVNAVSRGRMHAVRRCGAAATEHGTYVLTADSLGGGTVDLIDESGFLIEIESVSLRLTGKNSGAEDTWNQVLMLQQQAVSNAVSGVEAVVDPSALQWAGEIQGLVYVAVPKAHNNLRLFGEMMLQFGLEERGVEIQSITAELEVSYPVLRKDLPFWLRTRFKEHEECAGANSTDPDDADLDLHTQLASGTIAATDNDNEPLMHVTGTLNLKYPCAESMKSGNDEKCKKWDEGKKASECADDDLMSGVGGVTLLWPKVDMPEDATGEMGVECGGAQARDGGGKLYSTLKAAAISVGNVDMHDAEIELYMEEDDVNGTRAAGMISGSVNGYGGKSPGIAFFMFDDRPADGFDRAAGRIRPAIRKVLDKPPFYVVLEAESKTPCPEGGTELEGEIKWTSKKYEKPGRSLIGSDQHESNVDDFNLVDEVYGEAGKGTMYCNDPTNTALLRFDMTAEIGRKVYVAGGQLCLIHTTLTVRGYGAHNVPLAGMEWDIELTGEIETSEEGSAFGILAPGSAAITATRSAATQDFTSPEFWIMVELYGWMGKRAGEDDTSGDSGPAMETGSNHEKMFEFTAEIKYQYPCESKLTVSGTVSLDIEGGEVKDLESTVTIYCPGMSSRGRKAFRITAYHEAELQADFGNMQNLKVSHLSIAVEGKDSKVISPDVNAASWMPMASFAAVDVEGTINARVVSGYNSDVYSQGLNIWFEKTAGAAMVESALNMVEVYTFDFENDDGSIEVHLTGELEHDCTPMGSKIIGSAKIDKPGIFFCEMSVEAVTYECDPEASPQVVIDAEVAVAKFPLIFVILENVAFKVKIYHDADDVNATLDADAEAPAPGESPDAASWAAALGLGAEAPGPSESLARGSSGVKVVAQFDGTLKLDEELLSRFPALPGMDDSLSIFAAGQITTGGAAGFTLDELKVTIEVRAEFGAGSRVDGLVVFTYPCEKIIGKLRIELRDPLPHMNAEAKLTAHCGGDVKGFELEFTIEDLEVAPSVSFALVNVFLSVTKEESFSDMWAINATAFAGMSVYIIHGALL